MWNVVDFITNSLYVATIGLRTVAYFDVGDTNSWISLLSYLSLNVRGWERKRNGHQHRQFTPWRLGHLGSYAHIWGSFCSGQYIFISKISVHILSQSILGTSSGKYSLISESQCLAFFSGVAKSNGHRHNEVHFPLLVGTLRIFMW